VTPRASRDLAIDAVAILTKEVAALRAELRELQAPATHRPGGFRVRSLARRISARLRRG
jgi:hypothetical protein